MTYRTFALATAVLAVAPASAMQIDPLYSAPGSKQTRWTSPGNGTGAKGQGGKLNEGVKGAAYDVIKAGESIDLMNVKGAGVVRRMKMSIIKRSPEMLRSLRIEMYWDGADKPAVSSPLGDFFGVAFGRTARYETSLFNDPEGRSFTFTIPMPYKTGARIVMRNDGDEDVTHIYYNVNYETWDTPPANMLYFHAWWHRETPKLGEDFTVLPTVKGTGRYLGATIGVKADPRYSVRSKPQGPLANWWGEGEVKVWLDGDKPYPSLVGTGVEDYFGTAWGMQQFITMNAGCTIAEPATLHWSCYRFHVPDPIWFHDNVRVAIQQIGGGPVAEVREMAKNGAPLIPISVDGAGDDHTFYPLRTMKNPPKLQDANFPDGWTNYFRSDDWSATAYFYLDTPTDTLPPIAPVAERLRDM